jgi:hypothetical protein
MCPFEGLRNTRLKLNNVSMRTKSLMFQKKMLNVLSPKNEVRECPIHYELVRTRGLEIPL